MSEGFAKIRNGIKPHITGHDGIKQKMGVAEQGVYLFLHLFCEYDTGIYRGSAASVAGATGDSRSTVRDALYRLRERGFVNFKAAEGKGAIYDILIDKFEPTFGVRYGYRLNAWINKEIPTAAYTKLEVERQLDDGMTTVPRRSDDRDTPLSQTTILPDTQTNRLTIDSKREEASVRAPSGSSSLKQAASNLTQILSDRSGHWKFKQKDSAGQCAAAFLSMLTEHTEDEIAETIDYAANHTMYGTGLRTVSKKERSPWEWFAKTYDEIRAHMLDDANLPKRIAAAQKKVVAAVKPVNPAFGNDGGTDAEFEVPGFLHPQPGLEQRLVEELLLGIARGEESNQIIRAVDFRHPFDVGWARNILARDL